MQDSKGNNLWEMTWNRAYGVSSGLTPQILASSGMAVRQYSPEASPQAGPSQDSAAQSALPTASPSIAYEPGHEPQSAQSSQEPQHHAEAGPAIEGSGAPAGIQEHEGPAIVEAPESRGPFNGEAGRALDSAAESQQAGELLSGRNKACAAYTRSTTPQENVWVRDLCCCSFAHLEKSVMKT